MLKFNEDFTKNYDEDSDKGYILEIDVKYLKDLHGLHSDLPFLPERMKINKNYRQAVICRIKKMCCHIRALKKGIK